MKLINERQYMKNNKLLGFVIGLVAALLFGWGLMQQVKYFQELGDATVNQSEAHVECLEDRQDLHQSILNLMTDDVNQLSLLAQSYDIVKLQTREIVSNRNMAIDNRIRIDKNDRIIVDTLNSAIDEIDALKRRVNYLELNNLIHARWHMRHSPFWSVLLDNAIRGYPVSEPPEISEPNEPECDLPGGG